MSLYQKLLEYYNLKQDDNLNFFDDVLLLDLNKYGEFKTLNAAKEIIENAINNNEKIVIYGDYDCDGIMATSILVKMFKLLNYEVGYYIPSRYIDGYGLNTTRVEEMQKKGYNLIITVDNGIAQCEAIKRAKELDMKVIVTDHHQVQSELPIADVIIHPSLANYGDINCCGAYVALMLATKVLNYQNPYLLTLASIATISDMMILRDFNRDIVRMGLKYLNEYRYLSLVSLLDEDNEEITEDTISLKIAPKINALGRVLKNTQVNRIVKFFTSENVHEVKELKNYIIEINNVRRDMTKKHYESLPVVNESEPGIMIISDIDEGLIGLIANRLLNEHNKPVVIFTRDELRENVIKGSGRTLNGFDISQFLNENRELFISCGGHSQAAGMTLDIKNYNELRIRFMKFAGEHPPLEEKLKTIELSLLDINEENFAILRRFAPFGIGHDMPLFKICSIDVKSLKYTKTGAHIYCSLGLKSKIIGYNYHNLLFKDVATINIFGYFGTSTFRGVRSIEFKIDKISDALSNSTIHPEKI